MQGVGDDGGEMRARGTRAPTEAVAGRPPYQAVQGQAVQLLRVSGEGRASHQSSRNALRRAGEHGTVAREGLCPAVFGTVKEAWGRLAEMLALPQWARCIRGCESAWSMIKYRRFQKSEK